MENIVSLEDIVVTFDGEQILNHINLDIRDKEFVTLLADIQTSNRLNIRLIGCEGRALPPFTLPPAAQSPCAARKIPNAAIPCGIAFPQGIL